MALQASWYDWNMIKKGTLLSEEYYRQSDVVHLAEDLLGKIVETAIDGETVSGRITETEAYRSYDDKACHAHMGRFTERTKVMYEPGGVAYVYLCYGIHNLFNIITNEDQVPDAVLVRAIEPLEGMDIMLKRRGRDVLDKTLTAGPGNVSQALGISRKHNTSSLIDGDIRIYQGSKVVKNIVACPRVGIDYAEEDKDLPWRFYDADSDFVSKKVKR